MRPDLNCEVHGLLKPREETQFERPRQVPRYASAKLALYNVSMPEREAVEIQRQLGLTLLVVLRTEPRVLCRLGKCSSAELHPWLSETAGQTKGGFDLCLFSQEKVSTASSGLPPSQSCSFCLFFNHQEKVWFFTPRPRQFYHENGHK